MSQSSPWQSVGYSGLKDPKPLFKGESIINCSNKMKEVKTNQMFEVEYESSATNIFSLSFQAESLKIHPSVQQQ